MLSDKQDILNFSTNTSNNNISPERSTKKYNSTRELLFIPCNLRSNRKSATSNALNLHLRRDIYGSLIIKGGRKHKVSFIDKSPMREIKEEKRQSDVKSQEVALIAEVVNIPSYKAYNAKMVYNDYAKYPTTDTECCCESSCVVR